MTNGNSYIPSEWRVVQTFDPIRSADPRESVAHFVSLVPWKGEAICGRAMNLRETAPARPSAKRCSRCTKIEEGRG